MRMMRYTFLFLLFFSANSYASEAMVFAYSKTSIVISRKHTDKANTPILPWQNSLTDSNANIAINVEIRNAKTLYGQSGWFNLNSLSAGNGVLLTFNTPTLAPLVRSAHYAPLDVLFIDARGKIIQIAPDIVLNQLETDIYPNEPVMAFLLLGGGSSKSLSILPGDEVEYKIFKKPPAVLTADPEPKIKNQ